MSLRRHRRIWVAVRAVVNGDVSESCDDLEQRLSGGGTWEWDNGVAEGATAQQARTKARERRLLAMDADRAARDERIKAAAAEVYLRTEERTAAQQAIAVAEDRMGSALRRVLAEGVTVEQAAELCELKVAEARRLSRRQPAARRRMSPLSAEVRRAALEWAVSDAKPAAGTEPRTRPYRAQGVGVGRCPSGWRPRPVLAGLGRRRTWWSWRTGSGSGPAPTAAAGERRHGRTRVSPSIPSAAGPGRFGVQVRRWSPVWLAPIPASVVMRGTGISEAGRWLRVAGCGPGPTSPRAPPGRRRRRPRPLGFSTDLLRRRGPNLSSPGQDV